MLGSAGLGRLAAALLLLGLVAVPAGRAQARTQSSVLLDFDSGQILQAESPDAPTYPASLTKMMTLYLLFDALDAGRLGLDDRLPISAHAAAMPPTKLGLKAGSTIRVEDAIMALVTRSANDIASAIGENLAGSEDQFAQRMTAKAHQLGMSRTSFRNASGLPDPEQQTTARDVATLAIHMITDHPRYYRYFSRERFTFGKRSIGNHNHLLGVYAGMDGIKTGYTTASGFNLAASAVRNGHRLVGVVMGGSSAPMRDARMVNLLNRGFGELAHGGVPHPAAGSLPPVEEAAYRDSGAAVRPLTGGERQTALAQSASAPGPAGGDAVAAAMAPAVMAMVGPDPALAAIAAAKAGDPGLTLAPVAQGDDLDEPAAAKRRTAIDPTTPHARAVAARRRAPAGPAYGVQVGVYRSADAARRAAQDAVRHAPGQLRGTFISVHQVREHHRLLFRAQLIGVDRGDARTACQQLRRHRQSCAVVQASSLTIASK